MGLYKENKQLNAYCNGRLIQMYRGGNSIFNYDAANWQGLWIEYENTNAAGFTMTCAGNFTVDWGDGVQENIAVATPIAQHITHDYSAIGNYTVKISGKATQYISARDAASHWGLTIGFTIPINPSTSTLAHGAENISYLGGNITTMLPIVDRLSTTGSPYFHFFARGLTNLRLCDVVYKWVGDYRTTGAVNSHGTFYASFEDCTSLTQCPASMINTATVMVAGAFCETFYGCTSLTSIPSDLFSAFTNVASVRFVSTFYGCSSITSLPSELFSAFTNATSMAFYYTFYGCSSITSLPSELFSAFTNVTAVYLYYTFAYCTSLVDASNNIITFGVNFVESAKAFTNMFIGTNLNTTSPLCTYKGEVMRLCDIPNPNNYAWRGYRGLTSLADWDTIPAEWK